MVGNLGNPYLTGLRKGCPWSDRNDSGARLPYEDGFTQGPGDRSETGRPPSPADSSVGLFVEKLLLSGSGNHRSWVRVDRSKRSPAADNHKIEMVW